MSKADTCNTVPTGDGANPQHSGLDDRASALVKAEQALEASAEAMDAYQRLRFFSLLSEEEARGLPRLFPDLYGDPRSNGCPATLRAGWDAAARAFLGRLLHFHRLMMQHGLGAVGRFEPCQPHALAGGDPALNRLRLEHMVQLDNLRCLAPTTGHREVQECVTLASAMYLQELHPGGWSLGQVQRFFTENDTRYEVLPCAHRGGCLFLSSRLFWHALIAVETSPWRDLPGSGPLGPA